MPEHQRPRKSDRLLVAVARLPGVGSAALRICSPLQTLKSPHRDNATICNVPCPACGALTPLEWANIVFDRENLDEIGCVCPACGVLSSETEWKEHFSGGKFIAKYPERKVRGFHLNALASLFVEWREIVQKFLTANDEKKKGNIELLKVWTNTEMGQTWEEEGEQLETDDLYKRREKYNCEVPEEVLFN